MPSPVRRSARGAPPPTPSKPLASTSSTSISTLSSVRPGKMHEKSSTPHSRSSEETSEPPRRSQRAHHPPPKDTESGAPPPDATRGAGNDDGEEEEEEEEEDEEDITRCVCGHQDYPGPPLSEAFSSGTAQGEDAGGLFIQCDGCSVWQHGGCVGIIEESQSPDKYYCEECKPREHKLLTDSRGYVHSCFPVLAAKVRGSHLPVPFVRLLRQGLAHSPVTRPRGLRCPGLHFWPAGRASLCFPPSPFSLIRHGALP